MMNPDQITLTKLQVAEHQLDRALQLFLDESDYACAITLAGASEEILGKLLEKTGEMHSLGEFVEECIQAGETAFGEKWSAKSFATMANYFRNGLKHIADGDTLTIPREVAVEMLDRAIDNYWKLTGSETARIRRFMKESHGLIIKE